MASAETSGSGDIARTLDLLWGSGPQPSRGPKPGLTLDRIVDAAVEVADAEGLAAVTMRRVATEIGTGTMSLYRYLPGKAELLDLMLDKVQRPVDGGVEAVGGWRAALETLAYESLAQYRRHPWLTDINQSRPVLGPGAMEGLEKVLGAIRPMGLPDRELVSVVMMISGHVLGVARTQLYQQEAERKSGMTDAEFWQAQVPVLDRAIATGRYPIMAALSEDAFSTDFDHFGFGLQRILDGLEHYVAQRDGGEERIRPIQR
ncbi:TetR/AcrR family transcriptional regulator [Nocardia sp. NBC_00508]|uniref:TetR/AcrR family transcriptional regulator n=1 Tax=Nocardia sp. NBC_00508 TaxID=2975992 RepID=UPI002E8013F9|nr:TetR/AcrR family transcriptional regulator [Nocardia sp. NBC_00508]WUD66480.1 TetR/AcrR family transcriptional regulator [Nocardia sp. NBC_00508]